MNKIILLSITIIILAGCSKGFQHRVQKTIRDVSGSSTTEKLEEAKDPKLKASNFKLTPGKKIKNGTEVKISGEIKNSGGDFTGIKVTLSGDAVKKRLLLLPNPEKSTLSIKDSGWGGKKEPLKFNRFGKKSMVAYLPNFKCEDKPLEVLLSMPAVRRGKGKIKIAVEPLEMNDKEQSKDKTADESEKAVAENTEEKDDKPLELIAAKKTLRVWVYGRPIKKKNYSLINNDYEDPLEKIERMRGDFKTKVKRINRGY